MGPGIEWNWRIQNSVKGKRIGVMPPRPSTRQMGVTYTETRTGIQNRIQDREAFLEERVLDIDGIYECSTFSCRRHPNSSLNATQNSLPKSRLARRSSGSSSPAVE